MNTGAIKLYRFRAEINVGGFVDWPEADEGSVAHWLRDKLLVTPKPGATAINLDDIAEIEIVYLHQREEDTESPSLEDLIADFKAAAVKARSAGTPLEEYDAHSEAFALAEQIIELSE